MPSSKFSSPKRFYKRPAICKKVPPGLGPGWNQFYPPILTVHFRVADTDPGWTYNFFGTIEIQRRETTTLYYGRSPDPNYWVECDAWPVEFLGKWVFSFRIWTPAVHGEPHVYTPNIPPEPTKFDSKNIGDVVREGKDFRYFRIYG